MILKQRLMVDLIKIESLLVEIYRLKIIFNDILHNSRISRVLCTETYFTFARECEHIERFLVEDKLLDLPRNSVDHKLVLL